MELNSICFPELPVKKKHTRNNKPWLTEGIVASCKMRQKLYRQMIQGIVTIQDYKTYRNALNSLIKKAKFNYFNTFINRHRKDSKAMWTFSNSQIGKATSSHSSLGHIEPDNLNVFFGNLGHSTTSNLPPTDGNVFHTLNQPLAAALFFTPCNSTEIISIVNNLAPKTSTGFDNISIKLIKPVISHIAAPLSAIFNKSLSCGIFPDLLKIARIIPVFKNGDCGDPKNYRPISVLPSFSKILEQIIYKRLMSFFTKHNVLHASQHGFRPRHNTITAISDALDSITSALNEKLLSIALFIDVSKAFDSLDHRLLFTKLHSYGVRGVALDLIKNYFDNRFQFTVTNNMCSQYCKLTLGVPQGSVLGPLMYSVFVNDIFNVDRSAKCVLYADDTAIIVSAKSRNELVDKALHTFSLFSKWFTNNRLCLNDSKTHYVVFGMSASNDNINSIV
jgi:hypothetical protein